MLSWLISQEVLPAMEVKDDLVRNFRHAHLLIRRIGVRRNPPLEPQLLRQVPDARPAARVAEHRTRPLQTGRVVVRRLRNLRYGDGKLICPARHRRQINRRQRRQLNRRHIRQPGNGGRVQVAHFRRQCLGARLGSRARRLGARLQHLRVAAVRQKVERGAAGRADGHGAQSADCAGRRHLPDVRVGFGRTESRPTLSRSSKSIIRYVHIQPKIFEIRVKYFNYF